VSDPRGAYGRVYVSGLRALSDAGEPPSTGLVYVALCLHRNASSYEAYPSGERLAGLTGLSRPTVVRALRALQRVGLMVPMSQGRTGKATYRLVLDFPGQDVAQWTQQDAAPDGRQMALATRFRHPAAESDGSPMSQGASPVSQVGASPVSQHGSPMSHGVPHQCATNTTSEQKKPTPSRSSASASVEPNGRLGGGQGSPSHAPKTKNPQDDAPGSAGPAGASSFFGNANSTHQIAPPPDGMPPTVEWVWAGERVLDDDPDFIALLAEERIISPHVDAEGLADIARSEVRVRRNRLLKEYERRVADQDAGDEAA
jgi:hypothetical protein